MSTEPDCNIITITSTTTTKIDGDRAVLASIADVLDKLDSRRSADDEADRALERDLARQSFNRREIRAELNDELRADAEQVAAEAADRQNARDFEIAKLKAEAQAKIVQLFGELASRYIARAFPETAKTAEGEPPASAEDEDDAGRDQTGAFLDFADKTIPNKAGPVAVGVYANGDMSQVSAITSVTEVFSMLDWLAATDCVQAVARGDASVFGVMFGNRSFTFTTDDMIFQMLNIPDDVDDDVDTDPNADEDAPEAVFRQDPTIVCLTLLKELVLNKRPFHMSFMWDAVLALESSTSISTPIRLESLDGMMIDLAAAGRVGRPEGCDSFSIIINWSSGQNVYQFKTTDALCTLLDIPK